MIGQHVATALVRVLFPAKWPDDEPRPSPAELHRDFAQWQIPALILIIVFATTLGFLWYWLFRAIGSLSARSLGPSVYLAVPGSSFWALPAFFLGLFSSALPMLILFRWLLGAERYRRYMLYGDLTHGYDGKKVFGILAAFVVVGSTVCVIIGTNWYVRFTERAIVLKRPLAFRENRYPYGRVKGIARVARFRAPLGNIVEKPYYAIRFDDGMTWTTREFLDEETPAFYRDIIGYVSRRSNRDVREIGFIEELGP